MTDEKLDALLQDAARTYNRPPDFVPLDEMWTNVEQRVFGDVAAGMLPLHARQRTLGQRVMRWLSSRTLQAAAVLLFGIALGRATAHLWQQPEPDSELVTESSGVPYPYTPITDRYLGQAAALLIDLPRELRAHQIDTSFVAGARDLLLQTRLLLDAPAIASSELRTLLEDLEVVLIQLVRLQADPDPVKVDLLQESLQESSVISRLRSAVADYITD